MKTLFRTVFISLIVLMALSITTAFAQEEGLLNVNTATEEQLAAIPEVGPELAAKIMEYRSEMGDIFALDELLDIDGMDEDKLEKLEEKLTIDAIEGADCTC